MNIGDILRHCSGVDVKTKTSTNWRGETITNYSYFKVGEIKLPENPLYIEITATATKGTIAKIVDVKFTTYAEEYDSKGADGNKIITYGTGITFEVEGRKQKGRIQSHYATLLKGKHTTKYVRDVQTHEKVVVKNPVNKYKQEMQRGDWVIGVKPGKVIGIGRITRWTNSNVWAVTGNDLDDKNREFKFDSIRETFTMPNDEHVKLLTMAVLKGYTGKI